MAEPNAELPADLLDLAASHLVNARPNEALEAAARALAGRDDAHARALFVACIRAADRLPAVPGFRALMIRALET